MNGAFYVGATGLDAQQRALDVVANNIANINTPSYKRSQARFSELVAAGSGDGDATAHALAPAPMLGVSVDASTRDFGQGVLQTTGRATDLAISGPGFLELVGPAGQTLLWRGGVLQVNPDGFLAAANGMPLKAMIAVPPGATALTIDEAGKVSATADGASAPRSLGQLEVAQVKDVSTLTPLDGGFYQAANDRDVSASTPGTEGAGLLEQGQIEGSNVQLSDEMVTLMLMQRAFAASAEVVQAGDQLMGIANGLRR